MAGTGKAGGTGAQGAKKGPVAGAQTGQAKVLGQVARMLMRSIWAQQWMASHPGASAEQRKAAWNEVRDTLVARNLKSYRMALTALSRAGVVITLREGAGLAGAGNEDDGED